MAAIATGAALRFVAEQLVKRPEEVKILILVSDGQPAAPVTTGSAAEEDLRGIKQEYRRKGVLFIAAAIGEDKQNIERIYGDSFMDITDLNQLPVKLTAAVKRPYAGLTGIFQFTTTAAGLFLLPVNLTTGKESKK